MDAKQNQRRVPPYTAWGEAVKKTFLKNAIWYFMFVLIFVFAMSERTDKHRYTDFKSYYYYSHIVMNETPENLKWFEDKTSEGFKGLPHPLHVKIMFKFFYLFPYDTALIIWVCLKSLMIWLIIFMSYRIFFVPKLELLFIALSILVMNGAFLSDLGNMMSFIYFLFLLAFIAYMQNKFELFTLFICLAASFKYTPLILLIMLPNKKAHLGVIGLAVFSASMFAEFLIYPYQFSYISDGFKWYTQDIIICGLFSALLILKIIFLKEIHYKGREFYFYMFVLSSFLAFNIQPYKCGYNLIWLVIPVVLGILNKSLFVYCGIIIFAVMASHGYFRLEHPAYILAYLLTGFLILNGVKGVKND